MHILSLLAALFLFSSGAAVAADAVPASAFFPVLPFDAASDVEPQLISLAANHPLDVVHAGIRRAIIIIPDETRDSNNALATLTALAGGLNSSLMIISPQFLLPSDLVRFADYLPNKGRTFATWSIAGWTQGDDSTAVPGHRSISSFAAIDLLLMYLADRTAFPDLQEIVIAGFGAGGNFTQRYAAFSLAAETLSKQNIDLRYVVAGATSYLYQTASRPLGGRKGFGQPDAKACATTNDYPYGLNKLNPYARRGGINAAKTDYALHFITYLNAPAPDAFPDTSCMAMAQGSSGASRAENYRAYLQSLYGEVADRTQIFSMIKTNRNDAASLFGSACGMAALFGDGLCAAPVGAF